MILRNSMDHSEDLDNERCTKLTFIQNLACVSVNSILGAIAFVANSLLSMNSTGNATLLVAAPMESFTEYCIT